MVKRIGFVINPVAGVGGKVGLKGSDGADTLAAALALGAKPESAAKAKITLAAIRDSGEPVEVITYPGEMGEDAARECGLAVTVLGSIDKGKTTAVDTMHAVTDFRDAGVDLILFAGGDGTARNVLDAVGSSIPVVGIPAGVKIHSAVYAINPKTAGELIVQYLQGKITQYREAEVMDIDEDLFRANVLDAKLYGYLHIPNKRDMVQNLKSGRGYNEQASMEILANFIVDNMLGDTLYIVGPGSTMRPVMEKLGLKNTLLGVDLVYNRQLVKNDATESDILAAIDKYGPAKIVVTVIGGQGYVFGRGNQQISADVITRVGKDNVIIAASKDKMISLMGKKLYVDTGNESVNQTLRGYYKIITGYGEYVIFQVTD